MLNCVPSQEVKIPFLLQSGLDNGEYFILHLLTLGSFTDSKCVKIDGVIVFSVIVGLYFQNLSQNSQKINNF